MPFPASTMLQLLVLVVWSCLAVPVKKHDLFALLLPSQDVLSELFSAAALSYCPGLFEAMKAHRPPPLSFFLDLPSVTTGRWAIYTLVLEKSGFMPFVYIGSGTSASTGVHGRFGEYKHNKHLPKYVKAAVDQGFTISHMGLLLWAPIPSAADIPKFRVLFIAIEAALSFYFWAMRSRSAVKDYGMADIRPWSLDSFSYHGLCSHNPLLGGPAGNFGLTPEELEALAAAVKEKNRIYMANYHQTMRADPEAMAKKAFYDTQWTKNNPAKRRKIKSKSRDKAKAEKKYFCDVCNVACRTKITLNEHNSRPRHLKKVAEASSRST